jgi:hypothetical protein
VRPPVPSVIVLLSGMNDLLTRLWRLGKPFQWRFLWLMHAKFICGVTAVIRDDDGNLLLLRHRLWPASRPWGFESRRRPRPDGATFKIDFDRTDPAGSPRPMTATPQANRRRPPPIRHRVLFVPP